MSQSRRSTQSTVAFGRRGLGNPHVRRGILCVCALAVLVSGAVLATRFRIDNSVSVWFAGDDPALAEYRRIQSDFGAREWTLVAVEWASPDEAIRAPERERFVARIRRQPEVHIVVSAAQFPPDARIVREFLRPDPQSPMEGILVQVTNDLDRQDGYREALVDGLRGAATELPGIRRVRIAGIAAINGELNRSARRDMTVFFPAVALLLTVLGWLLFRNVRDTAVLLAVALTTVVATMGLLVASGYPLNMVTIMLPTVLIALSVADVVHLVHVFHATRRAGIAPDRAAGVAAWKVAWPCLGTTLTTAAGFLAFAGSSVLPIYQLAIFGATGVALAWVLTMTLAPALLVGLWEGRHRAEGSIELAGAGALTRLWDRVGRHPARTAALFLASGMTLLGLVRLQADTDYARFFRSGSRVPEDYRALQDAGFPQNPLTLVLELPDSHRAMARAAPDLLEFTRALEQLDGVHAVLSPLTLAGSPGSELRSLLELGMLSKQEDRIQLSAMMDYPSSRRLRASLTKIRRLERELLAPELSVTPTGTSLLWANMDEGVIRTQRQSLVIVTVVCFVILAILFRSLFLAFVGLLLSAYPVAIILGVMGLAGITLNMATVLIAGIAVGIAVDDTIHFMHAWQARRARGTDRWMACREATAEVGVRMVTTSVILIGSFAVMGASGFIPTAQFGLLSSATIGIALIADLSLLPVLLAWGCRAPVSLRGSATTLAHERSA